MNTVPYRYSKEGWAVVISDHLRTVVAQLSLLSDETYKIIRKTVERDFEGEGSKEAVLIFLDKARAFDDKGHEIV